MRPKFWSRARDASWFSTLALEHRRYPPRAMSGIYLCLQRRQPDSHTSPAESIPFILERTYGHSYGFHQEILPLQQRSLLQRRDFPTIEFPNPVNHNNQIAKRWRTRSRCPTPPRDDRRLFTINNTIPTQTAPRPHAHQNPPPRLPPGPNLRPPRPHVSGHKTDAKNLTLQIFPPQPRSKLGLGEIDPVFGFQPFLRRVE